MYFRSALYFLLPFALLTACEGKKEIVPQDVAAAWADLTLYITKKTPANTPTYASRCLGYIGLTMYEAIVKGYPTYISMDGRLNGLQGLPQPDTGLVYDWTLSLNAAQALILDSLYRQTSDANKAKIDSLENRFYKYFSKKLADRTVADRSAEYGRKVAQTIFQWSKTDGGHRAYLRNFDKSYVHPDRTGSWKPPLYAQSFSHHPLHPHWGKNRTFVQRNGELPTPVMVVFDSTKQSLYFNEFQLVYEKELSLTQEEKEIAIWWGDDPDLTFTPPGHSYYLAGLALKKTRPELIVYAETYARLGIALADAFTNCWKWKYHYFSERPNTFVPKYIDPEWESFWPDPPFPAFPSGHAIQAGACATVLTELFGEPFAFTDSAHVGRERDELREVDFKARSFQSFRQMAEEVANSRFYGGIHTPQDNRVGLEQGRIIAENVNKLGWRK